MQPKYAEMVLFLVGKLKPDLCEGEKDFVTKVEVHQRHIFPPTAAAIAFLLFESPFHKMSANENNENLSV